jgi:hypothetical protein
MAPIEPTKHDMTRGRSTSDQRDPVLDRELIQAPCHAQIQNGQIASSEDQLCRSELIAGGSEP